MADIITLASNVSITGATGTPVLQNLLEGMLDVSAYDAFDLQVAVLSMNNPGAGKGVTVKVLTSMAQSKTDDDSWQSLGATPQMESAPSWATITIQENAGVLRCLRWQVEFHSTTTTCTFSITGMARRKSL